MFDNNIKTEPIPERVFELCRIVSQGDIDDKIVRERMEPKSINTTSTIYYGAIREVCINDLKLISKEDEKLCYIGDKKIIKDLHTFRKYCNSIAFKNRDTDFYKIAKCFLESNDNWLKYNTLTDTNILREVRDKIKKLVTKDMMLGIRFWLSFLGLGYIQESSTMYFLPNMHIALQDYCELSQLEKDKEYTVSEFISKIYEYVPVALENANDTMKFNLAMSNALRQMHDSKEIKLEKILDSKETWELYHDESHEFTDKITHIVYKGVKRV